MFNYTVNKNLKLAHTSKIPSLFLFVTVQAGNGLKECPTEFKISILEKQFSINPHPSLFKMRHLATILDLDVMTVSKWFNYKLERASTPKSTINITESGL